MKKTTDKRTKEHLVEEQCLLRCLKCKTVIKGRPGICPKCQTILIEGTFEEVVYKKTAEEELSSKKKTQTIHKNMAISSLVTSVIICVLTCWIPFIGVGTALIPLVFSSISTKKTFSGIYIKISALGLFIALVGIALAITITLLMGNEFLDLLRN